MCIEIQNYLWRLLLKKKKKEKIMNANYWDKFQLDNEVTKLKKKVVDTAALKFSLAVPWHEINVATLVTSLEK